MTQQVTASLIKELRDRTGVGMGKCKEALEEANGDIEEAINLLRKKGMASAVKKQARETNEGVVKAVEDTSKLILFEVNAETDFVVQNERFQEFVSNVGQAALAHNCKTVEELLASSCVHNSSITIEEYRAEFIQAIGENIVIKRVTYISKAPNHTYGVYSHMGGKIVSMVDLEGAESMEDLARSVAMHVCAEVPEYLVPEEVPADVVTREKEIAREQIKDKPVNIQDKIIEGKLQAYYKEVCLTLQNFIKDPSQQVAAFVAKEGKAQGKSLRISRFIRWQVGVE